MISGATVTHLLHHPILQRCLGCARLGGLAWWHAANEGWRQASCPKRCHHLGAMQWPHSVIADDNVCTGSHSVVNILKCAAGSNNNTSHPKQSVSPAESVSTSCVCFVGRLYMCKCFKNTVTTDYNLILITCALQAWQALHRCSSGDAGFDTIRRGGHVLLATISLRRWGAGLPQ